jgi:phage terminase large subunit-like protein
VFEGWLKDLIDEAGEGMDPDRIVAQLSDDQISALVAAHQRELDEEKFGQFRNIFPDTYRKIGQSEYWPRSGYAKHLEHFEAGAKFRERLFMAGNRVGKTKAGAYETTAHLTGIYPDWWKGKRFRHPIKAYAAGKTNETTRDIVQKELLGDVTFEGPRKSVDGSGMIPTDLIGRGNGQLSWKQGVADLLDTVKIKHISGGWSRLGLKSYQQGRGVFEGTAQHLIWFDEEPPIEVYGEALIRTMTTKGIMIVTFTPLAGLTETVISFMPEDMRPAV